MEDALVLEEKQKKSLRKKCLNPCCNGRCTRTPEIINNFINADLVLILVVMEDALVQELIYVSLSNL